LNERTLRIGFYEVTVQNDPPVTFDEILQRFATTVPDDERRTLEPGDSPIRLQWVRLNQTTWAGELLRIRLHEDLTKARTNGRQERIEFGPDEGLGEETAFLFHPGTRTLVVHEQRGAVPVSAIPKYFKTFGEVRGVTITPRLKPEALERVARMTAIHAFEVQFGGIGTGTPLRDAGLSAGALLNVLDAFRAPKAWIRVEVPKPRGRHQDRGSLRNVVDAARGLLGLQRAEGLVEKLIVVGADPDGGLEESVINLLEDRLIELVPVQLNGDERIAEQHRHNAVRTAWNTHREAIERVYGAERRP
jgi:hypothetical protein